MISISTKSSKFVTSFLNNLYLMSYQIEDAYGEGEAAAHAAEEDVLLGEGAQEAILWTFGRHTVAVVLPRCHT